jgi:hypothetical protein
MLGTFRDFIEAYRRSRYSPVGYDVNIKWGDHGKKQGAEGSHHSQQNNL